MIELTVRNDGPDAVTIAQAVVNDAFAQFSGADAPIGRLETATVRIQQPWVEGEAYEVALHHLDAAGRSRTRSRSPSRRPPTTSRSSG